MAEPNTIDLIEFPAGSPEEVAASVAFFSTVFGWQYKDWGGEYSDTQDSGVASGINGTDQGRPRAPLAVLYTENLEDTKERIVSAGGVITIDIYDFPGGRRFHFSDPAGNELAVWSK